jgi:aminoglycoside 3-N-acetyltransferase I
LGAGGIHRGCDCWRYYRIRIANDQSGSSEIFLYDIAVLSAYRRKGIGRRLLAALRHQASQAGIQELFVAAESADEHALDFYRHLGGKPTPTTMFDFSEGLN